MNPELSLNDDKKILHTLENVHYYKVLKDHNGNYIRPYEEPVKYQLKKSTGKYTGFADKKRFLTIFDNKFKVRGNIDFNDKLYSMGRVFSTDNGIYIPYPAYRSLHFKVLKISKL